MKTIISFAIFFFVAILVATVVGVTNPSIAFKAVLVIALLADCFVIWVALWRRQEWKKLERIIGIGILFILFSTATLCPAGAGVLTPPDRTEGSVSKAVQPGTAPFQGSIPSKAQVPVATATEEPVPEAVSAEGQPVPEAEGTVPAPKKKAVRQEPWVSRDALERHVRQYSGGHPAATTTTVVVRKKENPGHQGVYRELKKWGVFRTSPVIASRVKAVEDRLTILEAGIPAPLLAKKPAGGATSGKSIRRVVPPWFLWWFFAALGLLLGVVWLLAFASRPRRSGSYTIAPNLTGGTTIPPPENGSKAVKALEDRVDGIEKCLPALIKTQVGTATTHLDGRIDRLAEGLGEVGKKADGALQNSTAALQAADKCLGPDGPVFSAIDKKADKTELAALATRVEQAETTANDAFAKANEAKTKVDGLEKNWKEEFEEIKKILNELRPSAPPPPTGGKKSKK